MDGRKDPAYRSDIDDTDRTTVGSTGPVDRTALTPAQKEKQVMTASGINVAAGIWLILAPFILDYIPREAWWNDILVGLAVLVLAGSRFGAPRSAGPSWVNVILGIWLIIAPFVLGYADQTYPLWNDIILGIIVTACAGWSAAVTPSRTHVPVH